MLEIELQFGISGGPWAEERLAEGEFEPFLDPTNGILDWAPERIRVLGSQQSNAHFAHTFSGFGQGPVKEASLVVRLRGVRDMPGNDALYLEYYRNREDPERPHRFRWARRVSELVGQTDWRIGDEATIVLNLAELVTATGTVSLLPELEDGRLDLVVQDDTCVEDAHLSVLR